MTDIIQIQESEYDAILRQAVAVLPWGHTLTLMRKFGEDDNTILYYAQEITSKGWNRELLVKNFLFVRKQMRIQNRMTMNSRIISISTSL
jgi:hypothetical protein